MEKIINTYNAYNDHTLNPVTMLAVTLGVIILIIWSMLWKAIALWYSARNNQKRWFVALAILQTVGILEIIYIIYFQEDKNKETDLESEDKVTGVRF